MKTDKKPATPWRIAYSFAERCQKYAEEKAKWIAEHPEADHLQIERQSRELAKKWGV